MNNLNFCLKEIEKGQTKHIASRRHKIIKEKINETIPKKQ